MEDKKEEKKTIDLHALANEIVGRAYLASRMGLQYGGDRDLYQALGYPVELTYNDFLGRYGRQDIAKAIIDRPVKATWQGKLELVEPEVADDTELEEAWEKLDKKLGIKSKLTRLDKLANIGEYAILLLGFNDVSSPDGFNKPITTSAKKLVYIKPFGQGSAPIMEYESNTKNPRYGLPKFYSINVTDMASGKAVTVNVHYSRVLHVTPDPLESDVKGTPALMAVFNRLMDMDKVVGGDAEMFWRGARPGYQGKVDKDYAMTEATKKDLKEQVTEYENNLRRIFVNEGVDLEALAQQIADPTNHVDVILTLISAVTGIPKRILSGSERGELSSAQDSTEWKDYIKSRREDFAECYIVRPLVDRLIELSVLPLPTSGEADEYVVKWSDLYAMSEKAMVEVGKGRANALREYTYNPIALELVPPNAFLEYFLGLTKEQITLIMKMRDEVISEEELSKTIIDEVKAKSQKTGFGQGQTGNPTGSNTPLKRGVKK